VTAHGEEQYTYYIDLTYVVEKIPEDLSAYYYYSPAAGFFDVNRMSFKFIIFFYARNFGKVDKHSAGLE